MKEVKELRLFKQKEAAEKSAASFCLRRIGLCCHRAEAYATFSSFLRMEKMKMALMRQMPARTAQI